MLEDCQEPGSGLHQHEVDHLYQKLECCMF
uniref:Uncharacterized protein n=1 Tax=Ciona intestinalis TaxID=7719 RepID=H2XT53_CIOIN